jgi:hypothetical protein
VLLFRRELLRPQPGNRQPEPLLKCRCRGAVGVYSTAAMSQVGVLKYLGFLQFPRATRCDTSATVAGDGKPLLPRSMDGRCARKSPG